MIIKLTTGRELAHDPLVFLIDSGELIHDSLLEDSMTALEEHGWRFEWGAEGTSSSLLGYSPSNKSGRPDLGIAVHLEFDDFGSYTELKLVLPTGIRDCLIRGPKDCFVCVLDLENYVMTEITCHCTCDAHPDGCDDCGKTIEFHSVKTTAAPPS